MLKELLEPTLYREAQQACANQARRDHRLKAGGSLEHNRLDVIAIVFCRIFGLQPAHVAG